MAPRRPRKAYKSQALRKVRFWELSGGCLGPILEDLGSVLEALGGVLEACGSVLEALGGVLEPLEGFLEAHEIVLEAMLGQDSSGKQLLEAGNPICVSFFFFGNLFC